MKRFITRNYVAIAVLCIAAISAAVNAQQRAPWGNDRYNDRSSERSNDRYNDRGSRTNSQGNSQWPSDRFNTSQERNVAGQFDYYALVLSWSPSYCSTAGENADEQCNRNDGKRFSFVLHGLWPQYDKGYPEMCRTARKPFVPQPLMDRMLDIMPSTSLIVHEYRKHGVCSGLQPDEYFGTARRLFTSIRVPERYSNPFEAQFLSPDQVVSDFTRANPQLTADMMAVACGGAGSRLKEIRFCFSKDGKPRNCGDNENQRRMCSANRMFVPPVRSVARDENYSGRPPETPAASQQDSRQTTGPGDRQRPYVIPRPRVIEGPH
jgi:ribonuclease T2